MDLTREFGLVSYGLAGVACLVAAWRARGAARLFWGALAPFHLLLAVEVELKLRFDLKSMLSDVIMRGSGMGKGALQAAGLGVGVLVVLVTGIVAARRATGPGLRLVLAASLVSLGLFLMETVSVHAIADVIYSPMGPAAIIGWLWILAAAPVTLLAVRNARSG